MASRIGIAPAATSRPPLRKIVLATLQPQDEAAGGEPLAPARASGHAAQHLARSGDMMQIDIDSG